MGGNHDPFARRHPLPEEAPNLEDSYSRRK